MSLIVESLDEIDIQPPLPVILPLSGVPAVAAPRNQAPPMRFSFPALSEPRPKTPQQPSLVVWPEPNACSANVDAILAQLPAAGHTVVMFTSPGDDDGKTAAMLVLAPALARCRGGGVLAVDADTRTRCLSAQLHLPDAIEGSALIYPTNITRLSILPPPSLTSSFDGQWIDELRERWPLVLLEAASLAHPETAPLAHCCDGAYLVVRLGHTPRRAVVDAARLIRWTGGRLLGCVVLG